MTDAPTSGKGTGSNVPRVSDWTVEELAELARIEAEGDALAGQIGLLAERKRDLAEARQRRLAEERGIR